MAGYGIKGLTFTYPGSESPALNGVTIDIPRGQFVAFFGPSGCGKTTLLRHLKPALTPFGDVTGEILLDGVPVCRLSEREQCAKIGFVMQNPDNQTVTDKVWHELAFGLESLGVSTPNIRRRVAEMAAFFGIQDWFYRDVHDLSGGQRQLLNLASVMVMQPDVLVLDEPTGQLDPIAAADFLATVGKINRELGVTVIITEHRLEEVFPLADRAVCMDGGAVICDGTPGEVGEWLRRSGHGMFASVPAPMRIYAAVPAGDALPCPITVRDGRQWLDSYLAGHGGAQARTAAAEPDLADRRETAVELDGLWFRYEKDSPDVLKGLTFSVRSGEFLALCGGNGAGKTTALSLISGAKKPYRGKVKIYGTPVERISGAALFGGDSGAILGVLPQNPQTLFAAASVQDDLTDMIEGHGFDAGEMRRRIGRVARLCNIDALLTRHPYDLSGGEQQRAALAKVLLMRPKILLLDEPTKGLDAEFKRVLAGILIALQRGGVTVIMVSHDIEFCAEYADRCAMFFDGSIVSIGRPREFFSGNSFYTTAANRMARHVFPLAVTAGDVTAALGGVGDEEIIPPCLLDDDSDDGEPPPGGGGGSPAAAASSALSPPRRLAGVICAVILACTAAAVALDFGGFLRFLTADPGATDNALRYALIMLVLCGAAAGLFAAVRPKKPAAQAAAIREPVGKKRRLAVMLSLALIPLTIAAGIFLLDDRRYYIVSMLVIIESMLPFALLFEGRRPQARELVLISVLCAIGVAGRAAFFMLPQFKPVAAVVVVAGIAFGAETGFLTGALTGFISNIFFGQGPWTPWQMFAFGLIGLLAGVIFRRSGRPGRIRLSVFGAMAALLIYGTLMDIAAVLMYQDYPTWAMVVASCARGLPFNIIHGVATAFFLWVAARPMLEKLDRVKLKYGLIAGAARQGGLQRARE